MREVLLELESLERLALRDHGGEQLAQARDVPLAVGEFEQGAAERLLRALSPNIS
jgi:hypothetical protein